jgi:Protein of unknown function (DUF2924)
LEEILDSKPEISHNSDALFDWTQLGKRAMCVTARVGGRAVMKRHVSELDHQKLAAEIGGLTVLNNDELKARWKAAYGTGAPARMKRGLLRYAVAYCMQEHALGGLKPSTRRLLERIASDARTGRPVRSTPLDNVRAGAVLIRRWGGVDHQGLMLQEGVMFRGKRHRSLSEVARVITGNRWSGPLFLRPQGPAKGGTLSGPLMTMAASPAGLWSGRHCCDYSRMFARG